MLFFTDKVRVKNIFDVINNLSKNSAIIIREYGLNKSQRLDFAKQIINVAKKRSIKVFIGKDWRLAIQLKADGVHFSDYDNITKCFWKSHKISKKLLISYSCHYQKSIKKAEKYGCDLIFYSPIFATSTHPQQKPIGVFGLRKLISKTSIPIYALGGIDQNNMKILNNCNIAGIGGISIFTTN
jgi:thiamine-phosphate pyrophosphorylase